MRSHCALYVDVGYLLASSATRVTGTSFRNGIHVDFRGLVGELIEQAEAMSGLPVLRVHWYDSAKNGVPDAQQERIGELPKVKLRLGRFGVDGQQKGVDLRIGLDMVAHARNGAADVFFLVSGDDDLTEAVEEAQVHGVQVVVLAVPVPTNPPSALVRPLGVSRHLVRAADEIATLAPSAIDATVSRVEKPEPEPADVAPAEAPTPAPASSAAPTPLDVAAIARRTAAPQPAAPTSVLAYSASSGGPSHVVPGYETPDDYDEQIDSVVAKVLASFRQTAGPTVLADLKRGRPSIPRDIDKALLLDLVELLQVYEIGDPVRFRLRERFWEMFDASS